jgi:hypothetical protein
MEQNPPHENFSPLHIFVSSENLVWYAQKYI